MKLKILQVGKFYPPEPGGMETHLAGLSEGLAAKFDICVLVSNRHSRKTVRENTRGVRIIRSATAVQFGATPLCPRMMQVIRDERPDLVHLHVPNPGGAFAILASGYRGPVVVTHHSDVVRQKILNMGLQPIMDRLLSRSRAIIATSGAYVDASPVLRRFKSRCHVIPLGIDLGNIRTPSQSDICNVRSRFPGKLILGVGRLVYYKGFEYLIRAMKDVKATLLLIGDGPLRSRLEGIVSECGVSDRVHILGKVPDTATYYQATDVFVLPSIEPAEAFGIVQLEAMAYGKPVVNTNIPSAVPGVSLHELTGLTVPPRDTGALAKAINTLLDDEPLRVRYGAAGRARVEQEFTNHAMTERTMTLYERLL